MKKLFVVVLCALAVAASLAAQAGSPSELTRSYVAGSAYARLYPAALITANPALVLGVLSPIIYVDLNPTGTYSDNFFQRTIGNTAGGAMGGTEHTVTFNYAASLGLDALFPVSKTMVLGGLANGHLVSLGTDLTSINYNANPESIVQKNDLVWGEGNATAIFGMRLGDLDIGGNVGLASIYNVPYRVQWTTDPLVNAGATYVSAFPAATRTSEFRYAPLVTLGGVYRMGALQFGAGLTGVYFSAAFTPYRAVRKATGAGPNDSVVTEEEYNTTTATWGANPGVGNPNYAAKDATTRFGLSLNPSLQWKASDALALFVNAGATIYGSETVQSYQRLVAGDLSISQTDTAMGQYALFGGTIWRASKPLLFRAGAGYTFFYNSPKNNSLNALGTTPFNAANSNHYVEVNWATPPNNDDVIGAGSAVNTAYHIIDALISTEYEVAAGVNLFCGLQGQYFINSATYAVFNLADSKVWEETLSSGSFSLNYRALIGVGMQVTDKVYLGIQAQTGSVSSSTVTDGLPTSGGALSAGWAGGTSNLYQQADSSFDIQLSCVIGL